MTGSASCLLAMSEEPGRESAVLCRIPVGLFSPVVGTATSSGERGRASAENVCLAGASCGGRETASGWRPRRDPGSCVRGCGTRRPGSVSPKRDEKRRMGLSASSDVRRLRRSVYLRARPHSGHGLGLAGGSARACVAPFIYARPSAPPLFVSRPKPPIPPSPSHPRALSVNTSNTRTHGHPHA